MFISTGMKLVAALIQVALKVNVELDNTQVTTFVILLSDIFYLELNLDYTFMSQNKQSQKYLICRSYKNDEFDWPFDLVIVT